MRIGVLTDLSGAYSDIAGKGTVIATQMAIDDFVAKEKPAFKIEMVSADHQNKGDIAANKAREWFEKDGVDVVSELVTTSVALAVQKIAKEKNRIALIVGRGLDAHHQRRLQRRHRALDLRHLRGGQRHRPRR